MSEQQQPKAAQTVFGISELLEHIMGYMEPQDLVRTMHFTAQSAHGLKHTTKLRNKLEQALFRRPLPRHTWLCRLRPSSAGNYQLRLTHNSVPIQEEFGRAQVARLHQSLPHRRPPKYDMSDGWTWLYLDWEKFKQLPQARLNDYVSQPPCTILVIPEDGGGNNDWTRDPTGVGIRLEQLLELDGDWPAGLEVGTFKIRNLVWERDPMVLGAQWA